MALQIPTLDDRQYADLVAEARRLIPVLDPTWTDHNPSDPGIALVELFAYLTEMLLYRLDRITLANQQKFLKLLQGAHWQPGPQLKDDIRTAVLGVRARERAVTAADLERLATVDFNDWLRDMQRTEQLAVSAGAGTDELCNTLDAANPLAQWWQLTQLPGEPASLPSAMLQVARARCVGSRNLARGSRWEQIAAPGHVSLIVLPSQSTTEPDAPPLLQPPALQRQAVWAFLEPRRILTTRHHVVGPRYAPLSAQVVIATKNGAVPAAVGERVIAQLARFLDPLPDFGEQARPGWPFGRDVYVSELYEQMEAVEGVDFITDLTLSSVCLPSDAECASATPLWHENGDLIGLAVAAHHLPQLRTDRRVILPATPVPPVSEDKILLAIAPGSSFLTVELRCTVTAAAMNEPATLQQARRFIREFFHPLQGGHAAYAGAKVRFDLAVLVEGLQTLQGLNAVEFAVPADGARLEEAAQRLRVEAGEIVNWHVSFQRAEV